MFIWRLLCAGRGEERGACVHNADVVQGWPAGSQSVVSALLPPLGSRPQPADGAVHHAAAVCIQLAFGLYWIFFPATERLDRRLVS